MPDQAFLPHFITEDIYLIKEDLPEPAEAVMAEPKAVSEEAEVQVDTPEVNEQQGMAREPEPVYLKPLPTEGNNLKHCLVLVESDETVLEVELKGLLEKIMGAVKRSMDDVLLVNVKGASDEQLSALLDEQNHRHLLAFGTDKVEGLSGAGKYEPLELGKKHYLKADSLAAVSQNIDLKKALWAALKEMF